MKLQKILYNYIGFSVSKKLIVNGEIIKREMMIHLH